MNIDHIAVGANAAAQAVEVLALIGDSPLKVTVTPTSRVIVGAGNVGLVEVIDGHELTQVMAAAAKKLDDLKTQAAATPNTLFTFTRI